MREQHQFFVDYDQLKQNENWREIIRLGLDAIKLESITDKAKSRISSRLASCYYYLGDVAMALEQANHAIATASGDINLLGNSYYLLSAFNRALSTIAKKQPYYNDAHNWIKAALELVNNPKITPGVKAKIYFNAGALYHDVDGELQSACFYYLKSMKIITVGDDYNRTKIRYIRILLELNDLDKTVQQAGELEKQIDLNTKTGVHFLQLQANIHFKLCDFVQCFKYIDQALVTAADRNMLEDVKRLQELKNKYMRQIEKQDSPGSYVACIVSSSVDVIL